MADTLCSIPCNLYMNDLRSFVPVISGLSSVIERNLDLCHVTSALRCQLRATGNIPVRCELFMIFCSRLSRSLEVIGTDADRAATYDF